MEPTLNMQEQRVMDSILAAHQGILDLGLLTNESELAQATHVLQSFVIQHMLERLAPDAWSVWFNDAMCDKRTRERLEALGVSL